MNRLSRWDPFEEMYDMRQALNQLMGRPYRGMEGQQGGFEMDVCEDEDAYEIEAAMPGVDPEDVEVTWKNNILMIRGESRSDQEKEEKNYHLRERRTGTFVRTISLPGSIDEDAIEANFNNGLLTLRLPKAQEEKSRRIQITSGKSTSANRRIESGTSSEAARSQSEQAGNQTQ